MIYIISPYYSDFIYICRDENINPRDYNKVIHINTFMKLLGRKIKENDIVRMSHTYDFSLEECGRIFQELRIRGYR